MRHQEMGRNIPFETKNHMIGIELDTLMIMLKKNIVHNFTGCWLFRNKCNKFISFSLHWHFRP